MAELLDGLFENAEESSIVPKSEPTVPFTQPWAYLPVLVYLVYAAVFIYRAFASYRRGDSGLEYTLMASATILIILWVITYSVRHGQNKLAWFLALAPFVFYGLRALLAWWQSARK